MVTRKSQIARVCGGLVAMNQAVGKPTTRQISVAMAAWWGEQEPEPTTWFPPLGDSVIDWGVYSGPYGGLLDQFDRRWIDYDVY